jgi:S1-C subfamily serine protease
MRQIRWLVGKPGTAAVALVVAALLTACGGAPVKVDVTGAFRGASSAPPLPRSNPLRPTILATDPIVRVVKSVAPAVVNVTTRVISPGSFLGGGQAGRAVGTGFIIRSDGIVVTNFHVVEGAVNIRVTLPPPDGRTFVARVMGGDSDHDLAVLKVNQTGLPTVPLGNSSKLALGERVIALGYALALPGGPIQTEGPAGSR